MTKEMIEPTEQQIKSIINLRYSEWEEQEDSCFDDDEKNSLWQLFYNECKEIAKQQLNEDIFEINYEQIKENYDEKYFEQKEIKEITQQATEEKIKSLKFDFISHCSNFSYMNDIAIEPIFHSVFSMFLKHIPIKINDKKILTKLHINWSQECLWQSTLIQTNNGKISLKDLPEKFNVLSWNFDKKIKEYKAAIKIPTGQKEVYKIKLEDGRVVFATENHTFFTNKGEQKIKELNIGDNLFVDDSMSRNPSIEIRNKIGNKSKLK